MVFSDDELKAIGEVQRYLRYYRREFLTLQEVVGAVLYEIARADADRITTHCLALLPAEARSEVEACADRLAASDYRDDGVSYVGLGPTDEWRARLKSRYPAICESIAEYYKQFGDRTRPPEELAVPEVDLFWETLRGMLSEESSACAMDGCDQPTVRVGVFCARHHYERIEGKPAPNY